MAKFTELTRSYAGGFLVLTDTQTALVCPPLLKLQSPVRQYGSPNGNTGVVWDKVNGCRKKMPVKVESQALSTGSFGNAGAAEIQTWSEPVKTKKGHAALKIQGEEIEMVN